EAHRNRRYDRRRAGKSAGRTEAPGKHAAHVGGVHRVAQLSGLAPGGAVEEKVERNPRSAVCRKGARIGSLRTGKDQGAYSRIPGGAPPGEESQGLDSL